MRIARACRDAALASVAVYADQDWDALHVHSADEAQALSGSTPRSTYLSPAALLTAARRAGADAVHPGCGRLAERPEFAQAVLDAGLTWIGSPPEVLERLGNRVTSRAIAIAAGIPVVPGMDAPARDSDDVVDFAATHGFPLVLKTAHGAGGREIRIVHEGESIREAYTSLTRQAAPGSAVPDCIVETYIEKARHVEVQVVADVHGQAVVVGTRDCSLQVRHRPMVAEAPAPFLTPEQDAILEQRALAMTRGAGLVGLGTVEFLLAPSGDLYFLRADPRLSPNHAVTEAANGMDLIREQFRTAQGLPLSLTRRPAALGSALQFQVTAEDPGRGFLPSPGTVSAISLPGGPGVRIDSAVEAGSGVPDGFDPLLATVVVRGRDRSEAIERARRALAELTVSGVATTLPFHRSVLTDRAFVGPGPFLISPGWAETERTTIDEPQDEYSDQEPPLPPRLSLPVALDGLTIPVRISGAGTTRSRS